MISFSNAASMKTLALDFLITFMLHGNVLVKILFIHAQARASRTIMIRSTEKGAENWSVKLLKRVYNECTNYTEDQSCKFSYETVIAECPSKFFLSNFELLLDRKLCILTRSDIKVQCLTKTIALANRK